MFDTFPLRQERTRNPTLNFVSLDFIFTFES